MTVNGDVKKRDIAQEIETYNRLEKYLLELTGGRDPPRVSFDEAINNLLNRHERGEGKK